MQVVLPDSATVVQFTAVAVLLVVVPGPNVLFIVGRGLEHGKRAAYASAVGVELGTLMHVAATVVGLAALIASSPVAFQLLKYAGAGYLCYLAFRAWLADPRPDPRPDRRPSMPAPPPRSTRRLLVDAALVNILNPKVALFFVALLPQFLDPVLGSTPVQALVLGLIFFVVALVLDLVYATGSVAVGALLQRSLFLRRLRKYLSVATYLFLSVRALLASPPAIR